MSLAATAAAFGVSWATVDRAVREGQLRAVVIGKRRRVLVADVERLLKG